MPALEGSLGFGKDRAAKFHILLNRPDVSASIGFDDETLNCALIGVEAWIDGNEPSSRTQYALDVAHESQGERIVEMMEHANRHRDIDPWEVVVCEPANIVANEASPVAIGSPGSRHIGFVVVEPDIPRGGRQIFQQRGGTAANV
jgi:hypothetical protein